MIWFMSLTNLIVLSYNNDDDEIMKQRNLLLVLNVSHVSIACSRTSQEELLFNMKA